MLLRPLSLLGVALLSTGCLVGPSRRVYVMSAAMASEQTTLSDGGAPVLQVETASLPSFLDNSSILVRRGPYVLESSTTGRWAERLSLGITHTLAADLARRLPGFRLSLERSDAADSRRLQVEIDSFDAYPDGHCVLAATWSVVQKSGVAPPVFGRGVFATPVSGVRQADDEQIVGAMAEATAQLADAISRSI